MILEKSSLQALIYRIRIGVSAVALDGMSESAIAWGNWITPPSNNVVEGFSIDKPIIKAGEEFTVAFDDPTHAAATWVIKASENDAVKGTFNANSFTTSLNEEGIYDLYLTQNGTTEVYRGKIQISPAANEEKDALLQSVPAPENPDYGLLYEAVDGLPEKLRLAVILFYFEEMDIAATAQVLGIPEGTVKSRLSKARKLMKEVLGRESDLQF